MKKFITTLFIMLSSISTEATFLEAKPLRDLLSVIQSSDLKYTETGMVFGFISINSCVYTSESLILIKNYCFPERKYPAKGFTILSQKFGLIDIYQEELDKTLLKRDIRIDVFPEVLRRYLKGSLKNLTLPEINNILEATKNKYSPACWSTNFSFYTEGAEVKCNVPTTNVIDFDLWATETQAVLADKKAWLALIDLLEYQLKEGTLGSAAKP
ncbi:MAG: hypothetical protein ACK5P6_00570 [Pseudobdellovibrionaceae bacterium]